MGASPQPEAPAVVAPHQPTHGDHRFAAQHPDTAQHPGAASGSSLHPTEQKHWRQMQQPRSAQPGGGVPRAGGVPGDKKILQRPAHAVGDSARVAELEAQSAMFEAQHNALQEQLLRSQAEQQQRGLGQQPFVQPVSTLRQPVMGVTGGPPFGTSPHQQFPLVAGVGQAFGPSVFGSTVSQHLFGCG